MMAVRDAMVENTFYYKRQPLQHHEVACIGWLHRHADKADCKSLVECLIPRVSKLLKRPAKLACSTRGIFTGQQSNQDDQTLVIKKQNKKSTKGIFIDALEKDALECARTIKSILKSPH